MANDVVLIENFVSIVGSTVEKPDTARDVDVLFRASRDGDNLVIPYESVVIAVRDEIRRRFGNDDLEIHPLLNPAGPHQGKYRPVADLVVRFTDRPDEEVKGSTDEAIADEIESPEPPDGWPPKPGVSFYTEDLSPDELWEEWGIPRAPFAVEPKFNGWRTLAVRVGHRVHIYFDGEDGDYSQKLEPLVRQMLELDVESIVLDGDLGVVDHRGRRWPRKDLAALRSGVNWSRNRPAFEAFDVLFLDGEDLTDRPFRERRRILTSVAGDLATPQTIVHTLDQFRKAFDRFSQLDQSEGVVCKTLDGEYPKSSIAEGWAKLKIRLEVKARVVEMRELKNGAYVYLCEWSDGKETGWTMPTGIKAEIGDTLTVAVHEINRTESGDVTWQNASVVEVDRGGKPHSSEQALRLARRPPQRMKSGDRENNDDDEEENNEESRKCEPAKGLPFHLGGSKWRIAPKIVELILSVSHRTYVEPYAGTGAVLLRKPVRAEVEVLNDIVLRKIRALRYLQRASKEEIARVVKEFRSSPQSERLFRWAATHKPRSDKEAFYQLMILSALGMRYVDSEESNFSIARARRRRTWPRDGVMESIHDRLQGVRLVHGDAFDCIRRYDSPDTLFYVDPIYPSKDAGYLLGMDESSESFGRLLDLLRTIRGKFILSCSPADIRGVKLPPSWRKRRILVQYSMGPKGPRDRYELLIANFDPDRRGPSRKKGAEEDGRTRAEVAVQLWEESWHWWYPPDGRGEFVAQYHWRGLSEDELRLPPDELIRRGRSAHLDLRFTTGQKDVLWGITVYGPRNANEDLPMDLLVGGKPVQSGPKPPEPAQWLTVARKGPYIAEPGEAGATLKKYARIDEVDSGEYLAGTWNRHSAEIVLRGEHLSGRFLFRRIEGDGKPVWTFQRVKDQPIADRLTEEQIAKELKGRGHSLFIYRHPEGDKPKFVYLTGSKGRIRYPQFAADTLRKALLWISGILQKKHKAYIIVGDWIVTTGANARRDTDGEILYSEGLKEVALNPVPCTIRFWHLPGTDFADVKAYVYLPGPKALLVVGRFRDNIVGQSFKSYLTRYPRGHPKHAPMGWATSIRFRYNRDGDIIYRVWPIEISILPIEAASNPFTTFLEVENVSD